MNLSAELFEQVVASLSVAAPTATDAGDAHPEQRTDPRVGVRSRALVIPFTDTIAPGPFQVSVRDLSPGGIGFYHPVKIALDEQFAIQLPTAGEGLVSILCSVVFWQPLAQDRFAIGARFLRVLRHGTKPAGLPAADLVATPGQRKIAS